MHIYLVRHGIAAPREITADDAVRNLTDRGVKKSLRHGRVLARLGVAPTEVWTSPLPRARQTADLMNQAWRATVRVVDSLAPGGDREALLRELGACGEAAEVALVGHEPMLGELATWLVSGSRAAGVEFKKGAVGCIRIEQRTPRLRGVLAWLLTPRQMAMMDR